MSIFRVEHKRNYTVVHNFIATDENLSWKAKGIWLYAFSRPDDWEFNMCDIIKKSKDSRESVRSGLKELEKFGYLVRSQSRENGQYGKADWVFHETPIEVKPKVDKESKPKVDKTDKVKISLPKAENPLAVNEAAGKSPLLYTDIPSTELPSTLSLSVVEPCGPTLEEFQESPVIDKQPIIDPKLPKSDVPRTASVNMGPKGIIKLTESDLYGLIMRKRYQWSGDEIFYAWSALCDYSGIVHDWEQFLTGTVRNYKVKARSENIKKKEQAAQPKDKKHVVAENTAEPAEYKVGVLLDLPDFLKKPFK